MKQFPGSNKAFSWACPLRALSRMEPQPLPIDFDDCIGLGDTGGSGQLSIELIDVEAGGSVNNRIFPAMRIRLSATYRCPCVNGLFRMSTSTF